MNSDPAPEMTRSSAPPQPRVDCPSRGFRLATGGALIFLLTFAIYWPALRGQFVWDDLLLIERNPLVQGEIGLRAIWFHEDFPLTTTAFWVQWLMWGKHPAGYHAINVLLHAINALLVWRVLARLRIPGAWIAGMFFAVHPVCAASVAWVSELKNTLSLAFFLASFWCYLRFQENCMAAPALPIGRGESALPFSARAGAVAPPSPRDEGAGRGLGRGDFEKANPERASSPLPSPPLRGGEGEVSDNTCIPHSRSWYWLSLVAFLLALLSKTSTVMLPVVLLGLAWWQRGRVTRRDILLAIPFFVLALVFGLMTVWFQSHQVIAGETVQTENFWGRLAGAGWALWFYLGKAFWPLHLNLIYPRWTIDSSATLSYVPLLLWLGVFAVGWRFRRGWGRSILFGLGIFAVTLFPVLGFFDMYFLALSRVSDHFQYLPLIAVVALATAALRSWLPVKILRFVATGLVLAASVLTAQRAGILANDETLWRDTLARNPAAWTAHNNLGCVLAERNKLDDAIRHFEASLQLNPRNAQAHGNLARALSLQDRFAEAEVHFQAALKIKPRSADIHKAYAAALQQRGRIQEAVAHAREALQLQPDTEMRLRLATLLRAARNPREAMAQYRDVLSRKPDSVEALNNLAWLLATSADETLRHGGEAVRLAEQASRLTKEKDATTMGTLAAAYAEAGRFGEAAVTAEKAIALATAAGNTRFAGINQQLLTLYRAGKAYHEPRPVNR